MYKESTLHQYKLLTKSEEPLKMEKLSRYPITNSRFGLPYANIYKANKLLFPIRLLELLLSTEVVSKFCASHSEYDFSYFNIFVANVYCDRVKLSCYQLSLLS